MSDYQHPTREEWREATRTIRQMRAEKRGLEALALMKSMLARLPDDADDVPHGTTSHSGVAKK
jgi:hypothetical protein